MWLDSKAVNCPQKWGNFRSTLDCMSVIACSSHSAASGSVFFSFAAPARRRK